MLNGKFIIESTDGSVEVLVTCIQTTFDLVTDSPNDYWRPQYSSEE